MVAIPHHIASRSQSSENFASHLFSGSADPRLPRPPLETIKYLFKHLLVCLGLCRNRSATNYSEYSVGSTNKQHSWETPFKSANAYVEKCTTTSDFLSAESLPPIITPTAHTDGLFPAIDTDTTVNANTNTDSAALRLCSSNIKPGQSLHPHKFLPKPPTPHVWDLSVDSVNFFSGDSRLVKKKLFLYTKRDYQFICALVELITDHKETRLAHVDEDLRFSRVVEDRLRRPTLMHLRVRNGRKMFRARRLVSSGNLAAERAQTCGISFCFRSELWHCSSVVLRGILSIELSLAPSPRIHAPPPAAEAEENPE
ncbi:hypothetical protein CcaCcLH18_14079 [Colletotrichum camelliae]|nr:hypothetical protein CcaCcLH18_14079 [Colletotrichum camelliae]